MARTCERPTCAQPADVTYGIDPYELVVTLEAFDDDRSRRAGVLCRDHADSMVVPNGWTLDDRREAAPRLFQTRESAKVKPRRSHSTPTPDRRRHRSLTSVGERRRDSNARDDVADVIEVVESRQASASGPQAISRGSRCSIKPSDLDGLLAAREAVAGPSLRQTREAASGERNPRAADARPATPKGRQSGRQPKGNKPVEPGLSLLAAVLGCPRLELRQPVVDPVAQLG